SAGLGPPISVTWTLLSTGGGSGGGTTKPSLAHSGSPARVKTAKRVAKGCVIARESIVRRQGWAPAALTDRAVVTARREIAPRLTAALSWRALAEATMRLSTWR